jgi:hypothetical protein
LQDHKVNAVLLVLPELMVKMELLGQLALPDLKVLQAQPVQPVRLALQELRDLLEVLGPTEVFMTQLQCS